MNEEELHDALANLGLPNESITHIITLYMRSRNARNLYKICVEILKTKENHTPKKNTPRHIEKTQIIRQINTRIADKRAYGDSQPLNTYRKHKKK